VGLKELCLILKYPQNTNIECFGMNSTKMRGLESSRMEHSKRHQS